MARSHIREFSDQRFILTMKKTILIKFCLERNLQEMYLLRKSLVVDGIILNGDPSIIMEFRTDHKVQTSSVGRNSNPGIS